MMKQIKILAFAALVLLATGFISFDDYEEQTYSVRLKAGQTVEGVAEKFYERNENGDSYDAWRYKMMNKNKALFADGRIPQVNDLVVVPVMVRK